MKVVLCAINSKYVHSTLAVWYLLSSIKKCENVECKVIEGTINEPKDSIYERIAKEKADLVAFSTYIWNKKIVLDLSRRLKNDCEIEILLGGPEVSYNQREMLEKYSFVDYIISGEGEEPLYQLLNGNPIEKIDGISFKKGGHVSVKEAYISNNDPPNPYTKEYFENLKGRISYIETSRGCPFHCAFCLSGRCGGVRFFDLEQAKKNIIALANSGTQTIKFIDRTFNASRKRAREIFEFIIDGYGKIIPKNVCFHFEIEGELLDDETFEMLSKAPKGLIQFEIGLQSFNETTLQAIKRKTNLSLLSKNIQRIVSLGNIHTHIDLIVGLPYEDMESFKESFNSSYALKPHMLQIGFLKLLHGSSLREKSDVLENEFIDTPPYEIVSTQWLSAADIDRLHSFEDVFEKMYNSSRFGLTCEYLESVYENPFDMFMEFSDYVKCQHMPNNLDSFTKMIFDYFSSCKQVDEKKLRDALAIDRLATNRMGYLPSFLRIHSPHIKKTLNMLEKNEKTKRQKNVKRAAAILLTENKLAYVDYDNCDYVTNRFLVKFTEIVTE